jgi:hypothetical protein
LPCRPPLLAAAAAFEFARPRRVPFRGLIAPGIVASSDHHDHDHDHDHETENQSSNSDSDSNPATARTTNEHTDTDGQLCIM